MCILIGGHGSGHGHGVYDRVMRSRSCQCCVKHKPHHDHVCNQSKLKTNSLTKDSSMLHTSEMDADEHSIVLMKNSHGRDVAKGHVTSDEGKQQVGSPPFSYYQCSMS